MASLTTSVFMQNLKFRPYSKLSGLEIVPHVPELQVDYRNLLKIIYSEPRQKTSLGTKFGPYPKTAVVQQVKNSVNCSIKANFLELSREDMTRQQTRQELAY